MLGMVASSIRARIPAITRAEEAITAAGRTNSSSREWIYRVDNTRYDLDISGVLLHRDSRSVHPIVVGMPAHESGPPRKQHTQRDAVVKIATWNVANMSTTETALAYMSSVLNRHSIDFLALTETHLEDDLLVGRLRSMNWNVEVRERDNSSTGGVAIVIHKAWDYELVQTDDENVICILAKHPSLHIEYLIVGVYVPFSGGIAEQYMMARTITLIKAEFESKGTMVVVLGDWNAHTHYRQEQHAHTPIQRRTREMLDTCECTR